MDIHEYAIIMMRAPRSSEVSGCNAGLVGTAAMVQLCGTSDPSINKGAGVSWRLFSRDGLGAEG